MNEDKLYAFIMRGELTKSALEKTETVSKYSMSEVLAHEYIDSLSLDLLDEELVNSARAMATVYTAIAAFENSVRRFVVKILIETKGENWWADCVSEKIRRNAERPKREKKLFPSHCDNKKNDSIIPVTPLDENVESLFSYDDEGHIYGRTTDAQKTIEILNLDCSTIVHRRKAAFEAYSSLDSASDIEWASEIARLKGRNKDNQYEEYCFAVIYFIEHYLAI